MHTYFLIKLRPIGPPPDWSRPVIPREARTYHVMHQRAHVILSLV